MCRNMSDNNDKLNQIRAYALENELKKTKRDANAIHDELDIRADALVHEERPGTAVTRSFGHIKIILFIIAAAIVGIILFIIFNSSGGDDSNQEKDNNICKTRCNDGTCSPSTGPGTCSYHGGIKTDD